MAKNASARLPLMLVLTLFSALFLLVSALPVSSSALATMTTSTGVVGTTTVNAFYTQVSGLDTVPASIASPALYAASGSLSPSASQAVSPSTSHTPIPMQPVKDTEHLFPDLYKAESDSLIGHMTWRDLYLICGLLGMFLAIALAVLLTKHWESIRRFFGCSTPSAADKVSSGSDLDLKATSTTTTQIQRLPVYEEGSDHEEVTRVRLAVFRFPPVARISRSNSIPSQSDSEKDLAGMV